MDSRTISKFCFVLIALSFFTLFCIAADPDTGSDRQTAFGELPYWARITGDNVYVRSGPGTNYYRCGKFYSGDIVKVVSRQNTWSRIVPTKKNFSWISKQYIKIDNTNPDMGIVTADDVRVYAGSEYIEPIHSDKVQLKLSQGDKVVLLGEEVADYYKIASPQGTYFWVSTQFTQPVVVNQTKVKESIPAEIEVMSQVKEQPKPELKLPEPEAVVPATIPDDSQASKRLKAYYLLQDIVKVEYTKPLLQQDYSKAEEGLKKLLEEDKTDKAARYAEFLLGEIKRFKLAAQVQKENKLLNSQLQQTMERIENVHAERKAEFKDLGQYAVIGTIKESNVYGPELVLLHYTVVDSDDKIICYALPAAQTEMESFVGQKVGLVGTIEPHPQTSGALVRFLNIEIID